MILHIGQYVRNFGQVAVVYGFTDSGLPILRNQLSDVQWVCDPDKCDPVGSQTELIHQNGAITI